MIIDGITCCVGAEYCKYLADSIAIWLATLDTVTVVTKPGDPATKVFQGLSRRIKVVETDVIDKYGAYFNKGAALNVAIGTAKPKEWLLQFDSDIIPSITWRDLFEKKFQLNCIHGAGRYANKITGPKIDSVFYPFGYFQLFHIDDPRVNGRFPLFNSGFIHAGGYDAEFCNLWSKGSRIDLGFKLIHQGKRRTNWFGPGASPIHMRDLEGAGFRNARLQNDWKLPENKVKQLEKEICNATNYHPGN